MNAHPSSKDDTMEDGHAVALEKMRNSVESLGHSVKDANNATLLRFLRARSMHPDKAAKMFVQHKKWRAEYVPSGYISDGEVWGQLESKKTFLQGASKEGMPLVVVHGCKHYPSKSSEEFKKFVVHLLDKTIASASQGHGEGNEKIMVILDLQRLTYKNIDARGLINGFQFLQAYYPERLGKLLMVHMPQIFASVWKMVSRFLDKATQEKIIILNSQEATRVLLTEVGEEILPKEYGGKGELVLLQDVKLTHWPPKI